MEATVDGRPLFTVAQVTWNLLEPSVARPRPRPPPRDGRSWSKRPWPTGGWPPVRGLAGAASELAALAAARGVTADAIAIAAALANPWASVVLSGAVTARQLQTNLTALSVGDLPELDLAEPPRTYWETRAARPWQ